MKRLRSLLLGASALALTGVAASAADLSLKAPPIAPVAPAVPFTWTGFSMGGFGGGIWGNENGTQVGDNQVTNTIIGTGILAPSLPIFEDGWVAGGELRYDYQVGSWLVLGVQGRVGYWNTSGSNSQLLTAATVGTPASVTTFTQRTGKGVFGDIGADAMFLLRPDFGIYAGGGYAWRPFDVQHVDTVAFANQSIGMSGETSGEKGGGLVRAGVRYAWSSNWSIHMEYDHGFFGNVSTPLSPFPVTIGANAVKNPLSGIGTHSLDTDMVIVGIDYKFGPGGAFNF